jgi:DNA-binding transcriptional MerR regulator
MNEQLKHAVTVAEMARMVGLSRSRFYQLIGKAMPEPSRDEAGRPFYNEEQQRKILDVRRRNCGIDGKPILFYAARNSVPSSPKRPSRSKRSDDQHVEIVEGIRTLGLTVNVTQVDAAIKELFPAGLNGVDPGEVVRAVFLSIKRRNSSDNVGR